MAIYLLCGFMGSGKSSVMQKLQSEISAIDLDSLVVEKLQIKGFSSIADFVEEEGWEEFRYLESDNLSFLLDEYSESGEDILIALGGGAVNEMNLTIIEDTDANLIYLNVPFEVCWERIKNDSSRPFVQEGEEACRQLYRERQKFYRRAQVAVDPETLKNLQSLKALISG